MLAGRTRRALDSTLLDDAVATQDTVTQLVSMIRRVRRPVPAAAAVTVVAHDYEPPGKPACAWDDPAARDELVTGLVNDARAILDSLEGVALDDEQQQLVGLLALVAGQDVEEGDQPGSWRIARKVAKERIISTVDPETRHMHKSRSNYRDGYKAHLAVEPETGIITDVDLTPANAGDGPIGVALLDDDDDGLEVFADSAYGSGPVRADLAERGHTAVIKPWPTARNPYLDDDQFRRDDFRIDYTARTVTCPNRHHRHHRRQRHRQRSGRAVWDVPCDPGAPPTTTAACSTSANTTNCSPPPEPTGGPGSASTTTGNGGHSSNVPSPGSSPTATAECATAASNATGSASDIRAAVINLRRLLNLGLTHSANGWASTPESGSGADKEGTTPSAISHPARPTLTLQHRLFGRSCPEPTTNATTTSRPAKAALAQRPPSHRSDQTAFLR